jgi:hypothetical protein
VSAFSELELLKYWDLFSSDEKNYFYEEFRGAGFL